MTFPPFRPTILGALTCAGLALALAPSANATTHTVGNTAQLTSALQTAVNGDMVLFSGPITLTADLPIVQADLTINGNSFTLNGDNTYRGFLLYSGATTVANLTITNTVAAGGSGSDGGGGGAGLGGALFVRSGASLTTSNVVLSNSSAQGGNGGGGGGTSGGGGGMGGNGGGGGGGGGGLGSGANGGSGATDGTLGIAFGLSAGGSSGSGSLGGITGGGGGGGNAGGGGGIGGAAGSTISFYAGNGGFGGGGGGYFGQGHGGDGGFGGGGGGMQHVNASWTGGTGGYGGGGGASFAGTPGTGGYGGGNGGSRGGGGGAGLGGALFVQQGGTLAISGSLMVNGNAVTAGTGGSGAGGTSGGGGKAAGSGLFLAGSGTLGFTPASGTTVTIGDAIADEAGAGGGTGTWAINKSGAGTLTLSGTNVHAGDTSVTGGVVEFNALASFGSGGISVDGGGLRWATGSTADISSQLNAIGADGLTLDTNGNTVALAEPLSGPGSLVKAGAGTLTLAAAATHGGTTDVRGGTLRVASSLPAGAVTVRNTASLSITESGTVSGPVLVECGGSINDLGATPASVTYLGLPDAPTSVSATSSDSAASVAFVEPGTPCGANTYTVSIYANSVLVGTRTANASPVAISGLTNGTSYTFSVKATNVQGAGPASAASTAVTPSAPPVAPAPRPTPIPEPRATLTPAKVLAGLPSAKACVSRRRFTIRLRAPKGVKIKEARVFLNNRKFAVRKGSKITAKIDLRGLPKGKFKLKITMVPNSGKAISATRTYRTCGKR